MKYFNKYKLLEYFKDEKYLDLGNLVIGFIIIFVILYSLGQSAESIFYDVMIKVNTNATAVQNSIADDRIIVVTIDDDSLIKVGRWPWPRKMYIELFDYLQNVSKAKVIAFDAFIRDKDSWNPESDEYFFTHLKEFPTLKIGMVFKENLQYFAYESDNNSEIDRFALNNVDDKRKTNNKLGDYILNTKPLPELVENIAGLGSVLTPPDEDKKIRTVSHLIYYKDKFYPSLSLSAVLSFFGLDDAEIILNDNNIEFKGDKKTLNIPIEKVNKYFIDHSDPKSDRNILSKFVDIFILPIKKFKDKKSYYRTWIKWYREIGNTTLTHKSVSAYKIFEAINDIKNGVEPKLDPSLFQDKIVVLGTTATAISASGIDDVKATPLSPYQPGVDIQASSIDNILNSDFMHKMPRIVNLLILLLLMGFVSFVAIKSKNFTDLLIIVLGLAILYFAFVMYWVYPRGIVIDISTPMLFIFVVPLIMYTINESRKRNLIENVFGKLVSTEIKEEILKNPNMVNLGGERADITILFSDIRGFTSISEKIPPEEISKVLIEFFQVMEPTIQRNNGAVVNYMGDAIMAIFGMPDRSENHAINAVKAAFEMQGELKKLQERWKKKGKHALKMGIGINTGNTFVGMVGSIKRMQYTAIGDAVNIASRLEQLNKTFNTDIIISQFTYEKVRNYVEVRALKKENIRGRSEPVMIYELKGIRQLENIFHQK